MITHVNQHIFGQPELVHAQRTQRISYSDSQLEFISPRVLNGFEMYGQSNKNINFINFINSKKEPTNVKVENIKMRGNNASAKITTDTRNLDKISLGYNEFSWSIKHFSKRDKFEKIAIVMEIGHSARYADGVDVALAYDNRSPNLGASIGVSSSLDEAKRGRFLAEGSDHAPVNSVWTRIMFDCPVDISTHPKVYVMVNFNTGIYVDVDLKNGKFYPADPNQPHLPVGDFYDLGVRLLVSGVAGHASSTTAPSLVPVSTTDRLAALPSVSTVTPQQPSSNSTVSRPSVVQPQVPANRPTTIIRPITTTPGPVAVVIPQEPTLTTVTQPLPQPLPVPQQSVATSVPEPQSATENEQALVGNKEQAAKEVPPATGSLYGLFLISLLLLLKARKKGQEK